MEQVQFSAPNAHQLMIKVNAEIAIWHRKGASLKDIWIDKVEDIYWAELAFSLRKEAA